MPTLENYLGSRYVVAGSMQPSAIWFLWAIEGQYPTHVTLMCFPKHGECPVFLGPITIIKQHAGVLRLNVWQGRGKKHFCQGSHYSLARLTNGSIWQFLYVHLHRGGNALSSPFFTPYKWMLGSFWGLCCHFSWSQDYFTWANITCLPT